MRLRVEHLRGRSLTDYVVAAQQLGHALQDATDYPPLLARHDWLRRTERLQTTGVALMVASPVVGMLLRNPRMSLMTFLGAIFVLFSAVLIQAWVYPVGVDAGRRAFRILQEEVELKGPIEERAVQRMLKAVAGIHLARACLTPLEPKRWYQLIFRRSPR